MVTCRLASRDAQHCGIPDSVEPLDALRQQNYAATLKVEGLYVAQMTVDGRRQFFHRLVQQANQNRYLACEASTVNEAIHLTLRAGKLTVLPTGTRHRLVSCSRERIELCG